MRISRTEANELHDAWIAAFNVFMIALHRKEETIMDRYVTGAVIRKLRESKGMTQEDLADRIFVSSKAVSKWETG